MQGSTGGKNTRRVLAWAIIGALVTIGAMGTVAIAGPYLGERINIGDLTDQFVTLNRAETATPQKNTVAAYQALQALQDELSKSLRGVFVKHRQFVLR